jgi:hypothetical protein
MSRARDLADGTFSGTVNADGLTVTQTGSTTATIGATGTSGDNDGTLIINNGGTGDGMLRFDYETNTDRARIGVTSSVQDLQFYTAGANERARISSTGALLIHKTTPDQSVEGMEFAAGNYLLCTKSGGPTAYFNRTTSDGDIVTIRKDGSTVGSIGTNGGNLYIGSTVGSTGYLGFGTNKVTPSTSYGAARDNAIDLGSAESRFDDVFATNGTIQTSDVNEKQDVAELDEAEKRVATAAKGLIRKFRWKDSVAEKGDDARIHVGVIAQDLAVAFMAEGLDPGRYGMFISSTWWEADEVVPAVQEVLDEEGNVIVEAQPEYTKTNTYQTAEEAPAGAIERTRLGVRYNQLLAFIIGAM